MRILKFSVVLILSTFILAACGGKGSMNQAQGKSSGIKTTEDTKTKTSIGHSDNSSSHGNKDKEEGSSENPSNQLNLSIEDTGIVKSNISKYKITFKSFKVKKGAIGGEKPLLDQFIVAQISIKNIGKKNLKAENVSETLEVTDDLKGSGNPDDAELLGVTNILKGVVSPGESITGTAVFDVYEAKKYFLVDGRGLADKGAGLQNKLIWTFKASEAK